ncbi:CocE/NonD family hydrolase [Martelella alba]|uniref:CocE/NonD family hydrolase n=1 Tax=Martelella alba TaxID=2590451 RepID=A0ABY2SGF8_9HYPH|nr:CocE/NonD family hydrolase [Martelella alba]TKI04235.1 CocE/NonD family hydrolase [Martelella alba]
MSDSIDYSLAVPAFRQITVPLSDGTLLTARLWLPEGGARAPLVLEWIPYRQSDNTAVGDSMLHGYFAAHGIAAMRIDLRGSGNSQGLLRDEYLSQEQDDAVDVIAWIAGQSWSNGNVGMIGISWGGFAALQIAARRPPALKAIITCCSTDDRYTDDVHYMGGALLTDGLQWGSGLFTQLGRPLDPAYAGGAWRDQWLTRLEGMAPPLAQWLAHPERDAFWRHGSICEDYSAIRCPVYAVGGWTDGYCDAILRMMAHLEVPRKALIGPWTHIYPNWGTPGPAMDFLGECLRFWRQWLLDEPTGIMDEPMLHLWQGENLRPDPAAMGLDGHWIALRQWSSSAETRDFFLADGRLSEKPGLDDSPLLVDSPMHCGMMGGEWCPLDGGGQAPEFQADQRADDGLSVCFDTLALQAPLILCGKAQLAVDIAFDGPSALLALRLNEVDEDGLSARVTFGLHRLVRPDVPAGQSFRVVLPLKGVAYRFAAGRRLRLALSNAYWPMAWAEPGQGPVRIWPASGIFRLPQRSADCHDVPDAFGPARSAPPLEHEIVAPETTSRQVVWDAGRHRHRLTMETQRQRVRIGELTFDGAGREIHEIGATPATASWSAERTQRYQRPGWHIRLQSESRLFWEDTALVLISRYTAWENEQQIFHRQWRHRFPPRSAGAED